MKRIIPVLLFISLALTGCFAAKPPPPISAVITADSFAMLDKEELKASNSLEFPFTWQKGDTFTFDNPKEKWIVHKIHKDRLEMVNDQGMLQVILSNPFVPAVAWQGAESKGRRKLSGFRGSLYHLAVGKQMEFDVDGQSDRPSVTWSAHWFCEVTEKKQARILGGDKVFEAFVVVCESNGQEVHFSYAPEIAHHISIRTTIDGKDTIRNLIQIQRAKAIP
ncbi:MAG: hypothetical protein HQL68_08605 [Magnetococcales bacterium]|nr:hypothetical protein [Magnetococcales bacterium]